MLACGPFWRAYWGTDFVEACCLGDVEEASLIHQRRHVPMMEKETALLVASGTCQIETMRWLVLWAGTDVNCYDGILLRTACEKGQLAVVKALVQMGANVCRWRHMALQLARLSSHEHIAVWLVTNCPMRLDPDEVNLPWTVQAQHWHLLAALARAGHCEIPAPLVGHPGVRWHTSPLRATWIQAAVSAAFKWAAN